MAQEISANALLTGCEVFSGHNATKRNSASVQKIYESIRTSYGPLGLDKMCIDASGAVLITNDGATILSNMLIEDPAARMLVNLALKQDEEVGDGTTSVVLLAAQLIMAGASLIRENVHPSVVVSGYRMAFSESVRYIKEHVARKLEGESHISAVVETSMASKIINEEKELFAKIVRDALSNVLHDRLYHVDRINILKSLGGSLAESEFFNGYVLNCSVASKLMPRRLERPRIACLGFSLLKEKLPLSVNIRVTDPAKMEDIRIREIEMTKNKCLAIVNSGATLVLTTGGMDEMCIKMFADHGIVAVRRCGREDLLAIARGTGTELKESMVSIDNEYVLEGLGECALFELKEIGDSELVYLNGCKEALSTVLLRGPNSQILDEAERALNDAFQVLKRTLESKSVVPGGGAVEAALSFVLEEFVTRTNCRELIAVHRYTEALLELPRILASNAGLDANALVPELLSRQQAIFESGDYSKFMGLNVVTGTVQDNLECGIVEPTMYKLKVLKAATEAAISVLRINEVCVFPGK
ncbi:T-complex protein 1 subunit alpha [Pancytospora philotis]|nr:T-complex protein 1 subunit alpha [Pancytospora philotis]